MPKLVLISTSKLAMAYPENYQYNNEKSLLEFVPNAHKTSLTNDQLVILVTNIKNVYACISIGQSRTTDWHTTAKKQNKVQAVEVNYKTIVRLQVILC
jgi:hypothetical protein